MTAATPNHEQAAEPGTRVLRKKHFIDSHKGATGLFVLTLMALYGAWGDPVLWVYLALHGTYGVLWIAKSSLFGDKQWEEPTTIAEGLVTWAALSLYWIGPWLIASGRTEIPGAWWLALCIAIYTAGVFGHFASDMQKHLSLQLRPGVLITEGLWSRVRNPNYLGELCIYLGFTLLAFHWAPLVALALFIGGVWVPNMRRKDASLSRYPEFAAYADRSWRFIPLVW
jgi:protein-S-isoprenylcysteine O-methyltransferase Ste14